MFGTHEISFLIATYQTSNGGDTWTLQNVEKRAHSAAITTFDSAVFGVVVSGSFVVIGNQSTRHVSTLPAGLLPQHFDIEQADLVDAENGWVLLSHDRSCHKTGCVSISALIGTEDGGKTMMLLLQNTQINRSQGESGSPIFTPAVTPGPRAVFIVNAAYGMDSCQNMDHLVGISSHMPTQREAT